MFPAGGEYQFLDGRKAMRHEGFQNGWRLLKPTENDCGVHPGVDIMRGNLE